MNKIPLTKKKSKYNNLDNFLLNNETQIIDLHDTLLDKYAYLGYLNKSKIENFVNLIIHNSILKDIKRPSQNIIMKLSMIITFNFINFINLYLIKLNIN